MVLLLYDSMVLSQHQWFGFEPSKDANESCFGTWKLSGKGRYFPLTNFISSTTCSSNQILNTTRLIVPESFHFGYERIIVHISLCHNLDGVFYCEVDLVRAYVHLEVTNALAQGDVSKIRGKYY